MGGEREVQAVTRGFSRVLPVPWRPAHPNASTSLADRHPSFSEYRTVLEPWFLHWHLAVELVGETGVRPGAFGEEGYARTITSGIAAYEKAREIAALLDSQQVPDLGIALSKGADLRGSLVVNQQACYYKRDLRQGRIAFHVSLDIDSHIHVVGDVSTRWVPTSSGYDNLSGRKASIHAWLRL